MSFNPFQGFYIVLQIKVQAAFDRVVNVVSIPFRDFTLFCSSVSPLSSRFLPSFNPFQGFYIVLHKGGEIMAYAKVKFQSLSGILHCSARF